MDTRLRQLLDELNDRLWKAAASLAQSLGVSTRSIRNYVARANDALAGVAHIESSRQRGYRLVVDDELAYLDVRADRPPSSGIPETSSERIAYLLESLLNRTDWVTLDELSETLYVSRTTISEDLREVERRLAAYEIALVRKPYHGIKVEAAERSIRLCLASLAFSRVNEMGSDARELFDALAACVQNTMTSSGFHISSVAYQNLLVHLAVAIERIRHDCYVPMNPQQLVEARQLGAFPMAEEMAKRINRSFGVELPEEEIAYIAIHLAARRMTGDSTAAQQAGDSKTAGIADDDGSVGPGNEGLVISDEVWNVVGEMLECIWDVFRFDFRGDLELRMNLARHIIPLSVRLQNNLRSENPLLADIKNRFPLAFSMALEASRVLECAYGAMPSEEEVGYLALGFALALERQRKGAPKKSILIVCASGAGSARLLEHRYREEFGAYLNRIELCDLLSIDSIDMSDIDYVFTTIPLHRSLPVPVHEVSFFLNPNDAADVRSILRDAPDAQGVLRYFDRRLFASGITAHSKEDALDGLIDRFCEIEPVPQSFRELVWKREEAAPTSFGNRVAMPHPLQAMGERTVVAVCVLAEPVLWNEHEVQVIFLVSIARERSDDLGAFYNTLGHVLGSERAISSLIEKPSFNTLAHLVLDPTMQND